MTKIILDTNIDYSLDLGTCWHFELFYNDEIVDEDSDDDGDHGCDFIPRARFNRHTCFSSSFRLQAKKKSFFNLCAKRCYHFIHFCLPFYFYFAITFICGIFKSGATLMIHLCVNKKVNVIFLSQLTI